MRAYEPSKKSIDDVLNILDEEEDEHSIIHVIGASLQHEYTPSGIRYYTHRSHITRMGNELWKSVQYELYKIICNPKTKEPVFFIEELVSGNVRDLVASILTILVSQLSIPIAIAIPICSMVIKSGINRFCQTPVKPPKKSVKEILSRKEARVLHPKNIKLVKNDNSSNKTLRTHKVKRGK